jgi:hypothetical protein
MYGNLVFRQRNGRTFVSYRPNPPKKRSPEQLAQQKRFKIGMKRVREILADPVARARYVKIARGEEKPVFTVALADVVKVPKITTVSLDHGGDGDSIAIAAEDITLEQVDVTLWSEDGAVLETGPAKQIGKLWWYDLREALPQGENRKVTVTARDLPGNIGKRDATVAWGLPMPGPPET